LLRQRQQSQMTPIIFVTAYATDEIDDADRYAEGAVDFISAPIVPDELRAKVSAFGNIFHNAEMLAARASEVQASADQLRLLTEAAPIGIFRTDADNRYVYTNPRWSEITDVSAEAALGQMWETILGEETERTELSHGQSELSCRFELPAGRGGPRIVLVTSKAIPAGDHGPGGWVGTLADVTAEAGAEVAMSEARDAATAASRLKSDFLANMSHEIRTPMNGVIGMSDLLLETDLDVRQRDYAQTVRDSAEALMTIINDILDFSKVEAGMLKLEHVEFCPRGIVEDVVHLLAGSAQAKSLNLVPVIARSVPSVVIGDPGRVRQILTNLIGNAIKFTPTGEVVVRITEPEHVGAEDVIRFEVSDTGVGIAADKLASIFQPFVQADTSTSRKYGGTGLGLAISSQLIALMSGDCGVSSRPGAGSHFWFTIRVKTVPGSVTHELPATDPDLAGVAALVIDDSECQREALCDYLTDWGMTVATPASQEAAARALREAAIDDGPFDVVLTDRPVTAGHPPAGAEDDSPATGAVTDDGGFGVPIVLMAGAGTDPTLAGTAPANVSLSKPIHKEDLHKCLLVALGVPGADGSTDEAAAMRPPLSSAAITGRLLLAEDNLINQKVVLAMLSGAGYQVDTVLDGAAAVEAATARHYDAILMDCQMPEMNGYEATAAIRAREASHAHTPIIALTAGAGHEERDRCLSEGMDAYLSKPVNKVALVALVGQWAKLGSGPSRRLRETEQASGGSSMAGDAGGELIDRAVIAQLEDLEGAGLPGLLTLFFDEAGRLLSELGEAVERGDALAVGRAAHELKGSSATVGAAGVAHIAAALETAARANDLSAGEHCLDHLRGVLAQTEDALADEPLLSGRPATAPGVR
jgi:two-component system sensor histidine kinase/response regulator